MIAMERLERSMREGRADGDTIPLPRDYEVVLADGSLAPGVSYSIIRRAVVGEYYDGSLKKNVDINSWDQLQLALKTMELTDEVALDGPLAGVSFDDLAEAVLAQFDGYFEDTSYPRANMPEALWTMRLIEVDGEPVPIGEDWRNKLNPPTVYVGGAGKPFSQICSTKHCLLCLFHEPNILCIDAPSHKKICEPNLNLQEPHSTTKP
jgi:hypothetical protein